MHISYAASICLSSGYIALCFFILFILTTPFPFRRVQIYRKVTSQILPSALDRVQNVRARDFIRGCLAPDPDDRPSAMDLLNLPFLKDKNEDEVLYALDTGRCAYCYPFAKFQLGHPALM